MKKQLWVILLAVVLVLGLSVFGTRALADDTTPATQEQPGGDKDENGMHAGKHIEVKEDGTYVVDLDAFATGEAHFDTVTVPADVILVLDVSGSMHETMTNESYEYTARSSQAYSYSSYGNNTYYYKDGNNYYPVSRGNNGGTGRNRRYLRYRTSDYSSWVYLTGTGTSTSVPNNAPTNNSGTIWTGVLYERTTIPAVTKLDALKTAVNTFIDEVAAKNKEAAEAGAGQNELSRIAIVKFSGNARQTNYANYVEGNETYYYSGSYPNVQYTQVVADLGVVTEGTSATSWKRTVSDLGAQGMTYANYGMGYADAIITRHQDDHNYTDENADDYRSRVVVMFTDGLPTSGTNFEASVANGAVSYAKTMKDKKVTVYSVAVHPDAHPEQDPGTQNFNQYLHAVSSNYPNATAYDNRGTRGEGNYYFAASNASDLEKIFKEIGQSSGSTTTEVGSDAVMKDIISPSFTLPEGANESDITIKIVRWNSTTHDWGTGEGYVFTPEQWKTASLTYGAETAENVSVAISEDGKTVDMTGFDYAKHFKATSAEQDTDQYDVVGGVNKNTAKIVVSFPIQARPSAVTGGTVATNGEDSGIYVDGKAIINFDVPEVEFTPVTYVVDYVTSDTSTDTKASSVKLEYANVLNNVEMLDDPSDDYLIGEKAEDFTYTIYKGKYGTISFGDDETDVQRRYVRYAPTTMNWDGYDRIFVKGESATESDLDVWAMLCVLPANSVFYEDTYITQTKTVTYNDEPVKIEYTGINYDNNWTTVGTEGKNQTYHAGDDMGWIAGLADDSDYANDMAHTSSTAKAKASFTFSGTGVDIYSRTNGSTGTITVNVKSLADENASKAKINKLQIIDTKAAAGDFFAVPVCTFTDLPYGKYTATITVTTGGQKEGRMTFYLDGVRVYNPIQPLEGDGNVAQMYGEKNMGAVFTEVRSLLGTGANAAALYIDEHTVGEEVSDLAAIEAAAKALADAQAAYDEYVEENVTPAKNAVSAAEYALQSAKDKVTSTNNIYEAAKKAYNDAVDADESAETIAKLEAAMNTAEANWNTAKTEATAAQTKYDAEIGGLTTALNNAINGKAPFEADIEAARVAYDTANEAVEVGYNTKDEESVVEEYDKDGPNAELYLSKNQQVAINVEAGKYYYIGLRSLNGDEVTCTINGASKTLAHTVDLYYEATPASGNTIVIKNTGDAILAITKLRTTGKGNKSNGTRFASTEETMTFVRSLSKAPVTEFAGEILTEEEAAEEEAAVVETPVDVTITEEPTEAEIVKEEPEETGLMKILSSFFKFFRR